MLLNTLRLQVIEEFVKDYDAMLTGSQISKKKKLNQKSVANALSNMEKEGFLKIRTIGKNKHFFLNFKDKETLISFIAAVEHLRTIDFYRKNPLVKEVIAKIKQYCNGIIVIFGSYASFTQKEESDLDIFIAGTCNTDKISEIAEKYGIQINTKVYTTKIFDKALLEKDILINEIIKNHILVQGYEDFIKKILKLYYGKD